MSIDGDVEEVFWKCPRTVKIERTERMIELLMSGIMDGLVSNTHAHPYFSLKKSRWHP